MRYLLLVVLVAFVLSPFLAGCQESTPPKPKPPETKKETTPPPEKPVTPAPEKPVTPAPEKKEEK
jgi:hypothetical protein